MTSHRRDNKGKYAIFLELLNHTFYNHRKIVNAAASHQNRRCLSRGQTAAHLFFSHLRCNCTRDVLEFFIWNDLLYLVKNRKREYSSIFGKYSHGFASLSEPAHRNRNQLREDREEQQYYNLTGQEW